MLVGIPTLILFNVFFIRTIKTEADFFTAGIDALYCKIFNIVLGLSF